MIWALLLAISARAAEIIDPLPALPAPAVATSPLLPLLPQLPVLAAAPAGQAAVLPDAEVLAVMASHPEVSALAGLSGRLARPHDAAPETLLSAFWDFLGGRPAASAVAIPDADFEATKPAGARLAAVAQAAHASPTARRVLRAYADYALKKGPVPVRFAKLGKDHGYYDYRRHELVLDVRHRDDAPLEAVPTLIHELLHVLQHAEGLPAESLEMELEAHAVTLAVMQELGLKAGGEKDFSRAALEKLRESPKAYVAWMAGQLPGKYLLLGSSLSRVEEDLEAEAADQEQKADESGTKAARDKLAWIESDLALVRSKTGAARYRAFAARVGRLLRKYHLAASGWDL